MQSHLQEYQIHNENQHHDISNNIEAQDLDGFEEETSLSVNVEVMSHKEDKFDTNVLPEEVWCQIFTFLPVSDKARMSNNTYSVDC